MTFWNPEAEIRFFTEAMRNFASSSQLFYNLQGRQVAYIPKGLRANNQALQSRNSLIGQYTEKWCKDFMQPIAERLGLFAVNGVVCPEISLPTTSSADLAFCTTDSAQQNASNIKLLFEIKMGIVNNYQFENNEVRLIGDYTSHRGNPSILRSDSMLKAIGKSINIRVVGEASKKIPIVILGNSPITSTYFRKVDSLKRAGIVQGFISLYPNPTGEDFIESSEGGGFQTFSEYQALSRYILEVADSDMNFMSSMLPKNELGGIIAAAARERDDIARADKFLQLLNNRG